MAKCCIVPRVFVLNEASTSYRITPHLPIHSNQIKHLIYQTIIALLPVLLCKLVLLYRKGYLKVHTIEKTIGL